MGSDAHRVQGCPLPLSQNLSGTAPSHCSFRGHCACLAADRFAWSVWSWAGHITLFFSSSSSLRYLTWLFWLTCPTIFLLPGFVLCGLIFHCIYIPRPFPGVLLRDGFTSVSALTGADFVVYELLFALNFGNFICFIYSL